MCMSVCSFILSVDVGMAMDMRMLVDMGQASVRMLVAVGMDVFMGMLQGNGIFHHQNRCPDHDHKSNIELDARSFPQE